MQAKKRRFLLPLSSLFVLLAGCSGQAASSLSQATGTDPSSSISGSGDPEGYTVMKETAFQSLSGVKEYLSAIKTEAIKVYVIDDVRIDASLSSTYKVSATEDTRKPGIPINLFSVVSTLTEKDEAASSQYLLVESEPSKPGEISFGPSGDSLLVVRANGKDVAKVTSPNGKAAYGSAEAILNAAGEYW